MVHPDGLAALVGVGQQSCHVVDHGHGVQPFRENAEPLPGHRVPAEESVGLLFTLRRRHDALVRGEVTAQGTRAKAIQPVGHRVHQALGRQPVQLVAQGGLGNLAEAGQLLHGGQGSGAQRQEGLLLAARQPVLGMAALLQLRHGVVDLPQQRPLAPGVVNQFLGGGVNGLGIVAHGAGHGAGQGAAQVTAFQEAPEGVAGDAEPLGGLGPAVPQGVGAHVIAYGVVKVWVFRCRLLAPL